MEKTTRRRSLLSILIALMFILAPLGMLRVRADQGVTSYAKRQIENSGTSYDIYITNKSGKSMKGSTITFTIPDGAHFDGAWSTTQSKVEGNKVTLVIGDANWQNPPPGETLKVAGFNISGVSMDWVPSISISPILEDPAPATPTPVPATPTPVPATPTTAPTTAPTKAPTSAPTAAPTSAPTETKPTPAETTPAPTETTPEATETSETGAVSLDPVDGDDWLTTVGNRIVDKNGTQVWLTGINWFGYNTGSNIFDGCWSCNMETAIRSIADHGFNLLRIPMSSELVLAWKNGQYPEANYNKATNAELEGKNSQQIFDYALSLCQKYGLKVMLDIHSANTDASGHMTNLWYTDKVSIQDYYDSVQYLADRYKKVDTIVAFDLKNEPHGKANEDKAIWNDSELDNNWKHVAEVAGNLALDANPNLLIVIEGIEIYPKDINANKDFSSTNMDDYNTTWWGANLRGVKDYPIDFGTEARNRQIVYSPHDYGPTVYEQPWFQGEFTYDSLKTDCWNDNWLYIHNERIAPVLIGEWGGYMTEPNLTWMTYLRQLIAENHLNFTFWCFNSNSGDTGGLVLDDFTTWDDEKYAFVKEVLWQQDGKFVGLDHAVPLGNRGISLSEYQGVIDPDNTPAPATEMTTTLPDGGETQAPAETTKAAAAAATVAAKKNGIPVGTIVLYGFLFLLLILVAVLVYMFFKNPKAWNNMIDRLHLPEKLKRDIPWEVAPQTAAADGASKNNEFAGRYRPVAKTATPAATKSTSASAKTGAAITGAAAAAATTTKSAFNQEDSTETTMSAFKPSSSGPVKRPNMRPSAQNRLRTVEDLEAEVNRLAEEMKAEEARKAAEAGTAGIGAGSILEEAAMLEPAKAETPVPAEEPVVDTVPSVDDEVENLLLTTPLPSAATAPKEEEDDENIPSIVRSLRAQERAQAEGKTAEPEVAPTWDSAPALDRPIWAKPNNPASSDVSDVYAPENAEKTVRKGPIKRPNMRPSAKKPDDPKNDIK